VLLNTSFNGPKEPMVESPEDAIKTFLERNLDILVINNFIIRRGL
jgi:carbamoyltransferase